jgi:site-specific DNA recombinase
VSSVFLTGRTPRVRAVIYARLSEDHERAESVPTQIANGTKYAERMGWDVVRVFKDKGLSGYTGEVRPGFEEMIEFLGTGQADVLIARHHDRLTRNPDDFARLMQVCGKAKIKISLYTGGELDLSTASGGFYGFMETGRAWCESAIRSQRVKDAVERNARAGKRSGGGSRPFGYTIIRHDLGEGGRRRYRIIGEESEPAEAEAIKEAAARVLRGESIRSIAFDFNDRGIRAVGGGRWAGSTLRRVLVSPRIAGLREHNGEVVGDAAWPAIIDRATHDRLVGLLDDPSRRRENFGRPRVHPLVGLVYCASCGGKMTTAVAPEAGTRIRLPQLAREHNRLRIFWSVVAMRRSASRRARQEWLYVDPNTHAARTRTRTHQASPVTRRLCRDSAPGIHANVSGTSYC